MGDAAPAVPARQAELALSFARGLVRAGVSELVLSPGSRSTPLVWAFGLTSIRIHVVVDERAAGFAALGMARASGRRVALLCTSGTAGAHYLPALIEASATGTPLLAITADRPLERHDNGSSQTIDQTRLFGRFASALTLPVATTGVPRATLLRAASRVARQAVAMALETRAPVHVNAPFHKPLEPGDDVDPEAIPDPRLPAPDAASHGAPPDAVGRVLATLRRARRPVIVVGPAAPALAEAREALTHVAAHLGVPVLAEACSNVGGLTGLDLVLRHVDGDALRPDAILQLGAPPVSGAWSRLLDRDPPRAHIVWTEHAWPDAENTASEVVRVGSLVAAIELLAAAAHSIALPIVDGDAPGDKPWSRATSAAHEARAGALRDTPLCGPTCADAVRHAMRASGSEAQLVLGNSMIIRDDEDASVPLPDGVRVLTQRGAAGIDGIVSGAWGAALATGLPTCVMHGDVSAVHDLHGLVLARDTSTPLVIVVVDNDGGRIFEQLPAADHPATREQLEARWVAPTGVDAAAIAAALGLSARTVDDAATLRNAVLEGLTTPGATLVRAIVRPADDRLARARVRDAVRTALHEALR